jgi:adenylyltransferase/sulfurtransferase
VGEAVRNFADAFPDIKPHLYQEGGDQGSPELRSFINVFVGEDNIKKLQGLDTKLADWLTIMLVPAIAGGLKEDLYREDYFGKYYQGSGTF